MGLHEIYSYALLTKREVKVARYGSSSFDAFSWNEVHKNAEKERGQYSAVLTK